MCLQRFPQKPQHVGSIVRTVIHVRTGDSEGVHLAFCKKIFQQWVCIPFVDDVDRIFPSFGIGVIIRKVQQDIAGSQ